MDLSTLNSGNTDRKKRKRVGRGPGSGHGKTSCRGHKGQKARAGYSRRAGFEGGQMPLHRRIPKRGFWHGDRFPLAVVNVDSLDRTFDAGAQVTLATLLEKGLVNKQCVGVKLLGRGELTKKMSITVNSVSPGAREKVEKAGGSVDLIVRSEASGDTTKETR